MAAMAAAPATEQATREIIDTYAAPSRTIVLRGDETLQPDPAGFAVTPSETAALVYRFAASGDIPYAWSPIHGDGAAGTIRVGAE